MKIVASCKKIAESKWFQNVITVAILFAGVLVGIATYPEFNAKHEPLLELLNKVVLVIFII